MFFFIISNLLISLIIVLLSLLGISFFTLWERKLLAGIQRRHGPVFIGVFGLLQPFADGLKLLLKVINIPYGVYYYIYLLASVFSLTFSLLPWSVIPFNSKFVFADINLSLIFILVVSSLNVYTILFSGWSSNSKYGMLGSVRAGAQMVSYELPMSISLLPIFLITSTANLTNIVLFQQQSFWFVVLLPCAFIFFVAALAETNRTPFDLPEAESELVAGYNMEYSSLSFALFFLAEYNHIILMSTIFSLVFLGGWSLVNLDFIFNFISFILFKLFGTTYLLFIIKYKIFVINCCISLGSGFLVLILTLKVWFLESMILIIKSMLVISLFVVIRASVPRYKFTQLISMCRESFIPLILLFFVLVLVFLVF
jgi:NADH:ubiquinone oxidoreductase subunit H